MKTRMRGTMMAAGLVAATMTGAANADHRDFRRGKIDADVDVSASLRLTRDAALLHVDAEVELEGRRALRGERFQLLVTVESAYVPYGGRIVRPQTFVIPLDRPSDIDGDEIEFHERMTLRLSRRMLRAAGNLVIRAELIRLSDGRLIESDRQFVSREFDRPRRAPHRRFGRRHIW